MPVQNIYERIERIISNDEQVKLKIIEESGRDEVDCSN